MGMSTDNSGEDSDEDRLDADLDDRMMMMMDDDLGGGGGVGSGIGSDVTIGPDGKKKRLVSYWKMMIVMMMMIMMMMMIWEAEAASGAA